MRLEEIRYPANGESHGGLLLVLYYDNSSKSERNVVKDIAGHIAEAIGGKIHVVVIPQDNVQMPMPEGAGPMPGGMWPDPAQIDWSRFYEFRQELDRLKDSGIDARGSAAKAIRQLQDEYLS